MTLKVLTPQDVADFLKVSISWVYKNADMLGVVRVKGVLRFPTREVIYERLFGAGNKDLAIQLCDERDSVQRIRLQDNDGCAACGGECTQGLAEPAGKAAANRHGLLGAAE